MGDPVIRPKNGLLLFALQSAEGTAATPSALTDAIPIEEDSFTKNNPYTTEAVNEVNGSLVSSAPLVVGQPSTMSFRSRLKGAGPGTTYSASVKPPLHAPLQACGWRGQFTAAIAAAALTAGSTTSATLGTGFNTNAQAYRGMPLILSGGPGAGYMPLITDYTSGKVATLSDQLAALTTSTLAALPANWSYAGTSPRDGAARATDHPCGTMYWYEDGKLFQWIDCRGTVDMEGQSARPGVGTFNFTGIFMGVTDVAVPSNVVIASHSAPTLLKGSGLPAAIVVNRKELPISTWSLNTGGEVESPEDPNTTTGFMGGQIAGRTPMFECDPLATLVAARDALAEIAGLSNYPAALRFGSTVGNRFSLLMPQVQPVNVTDGTRGSLRSDQMQYQALSPGRDFYDRDGDRILTFF